jgi:hypothetical protein
VDQTKKKTFSKLRINRKRVKKMGAHLEGLLDRIKERLEAKDRIFQGIFFSNQGWLQLILQRIQLEKKVKEEKLTLQKFSTKNFTMMNQ